MEKEKIAIEKPIRIDRYSITPITRSYLSWRKSGSGMFLICYKSPLAVIVASESEKGTLHPIATDVSPEYLVEKVPGLKALLTV